MQQSPLPIVFHSCTAMLGDIVLADAETVTLSYTGTRFSGDIHVPDGVQRPTRDQPIHLFVPGHGPVEIRVADLPPGLAQPGMLHFEVEWMSPELRATCNGN